MAKAPAPGRKSGGLYAQVPHPSIAIVTAIPCSGFTTLLQQPGEMPWPSHFAPTRKIQTLVGHCATVAIVRDQPVAERTTVTV